MYGVGQAATGWTVTSGTPINQVTPSSTTVIGADDTMPESNTDGYSFTEKTSFKLPTMVFANLAPGETVVNGSTSGSGVTLGAGTVVDSYFFHFDPVRSDDVRYVGTITFDRPILGVVFDVTNLNLSDNVLGAAGATYFYHGLENPDDITSISGNVLTYSFRTNSAVDEFRVITEAVPEPFTMGLAALGLAASSRMRRRRA